MLTQTAKRPYTRRVKPAPIDPGFLYPIEEFLKAAGIGRTTLIRAKARGVEPKMIRVGSCKFITGADGIEFLRAASAAQAAEKGAA